MPPHKYDAKSEDRAVDPVGPFAAGPFLISQGDY